MCKKCINTFMVRRYNILICFFGSITDNTFARVKNSIIILIVFRTGQYPFNKNLNNRQPGYLIDSFSNASVNYSLYDKNLASDYVFRFNQSGISNATSPLAKSWSGSGSYTLENLTSANEGAYISNYKNLSSSTYKAINLKNNQFLKLTFAANANISFDDFDLFFVCSFDDFTSTDTDVYCSVFDWYLNEKNITSSQFNIKNFEI